MKQQVSRLERSEKADLYKIKKHKDLAFMLDIKADQISENITKYLLKEGSGPQINQIKVPISLHYSYEKYDYTGKLIIRVQNKTLQIPYNLKQNEAEESNISSCLLSMRPMQKSWFNIELSDRSSTNCSGYHGYHYEIILDKFEYKNDNTYASKKLIYEDNREKGKQLFVANNFKEAIKIYRHSINILSGLSKKFFTQDQKKQLEGFRQKSEANFLKCLAKLNGFGGRHDKEISKLAFEISEKFMKKYPESPNSYYQKAIVLKYQSKFGDAEETIKEGLNKKFSEDEQEAAKQRNTLKNMKEQIKKAKERNIRHLHREEIRKRKNERRNKNVWSKENDTWSSSEDEA